MTEIKLPPTNKTDSRDFDHIEIRRMETQLKQIQEILDSGKIVKASRWHELGTFRVEKYLDRIEYDDMYDADLICMGGSNLGLLSWHEYEFEAVDAAGEDTSDIRGDNIKLNVVTNE